MEGVYTPYPKMTWYEYFIIAIPVIAVLLIIIEFTGLADWILSLF